MSFASPLINALGETAYILSRSLGTRNAVTNQPAVTYTGDFASGDFDCDDFVCATEVKMMMKHIQTRETDNPSGRASEVRHQGYVAGTVDIEHLDWVEYHDILYEVESVEQSEYHLAEIGYKKVNMLRIDEQ